MLTLLLLAITLTHFGFIALAIRRQGIDSPLSLVATLNFLRVVPFATLVAGDPSYLDSRVVNYVGIGSLPVVLGEYLLLEWIVSTIFFGWIYHRKLEWKVGNNGLRLGRNVSAVFFFIGVSLLAYRIATAGGIEYLLENLARRSQIVRGLGFLVVPTYFCFAASVVIAASRYGRKGQLVDRVLFFLYLLGGMVLLAAFGGRKNGLLLLLTGLVAWTVLVRPIVARPTVVVSSVLVFLIYMNGVWLLRQPGGIEVAIAQPGMMVRESFLMVLETFSQLSYLETYLVSIAHFSHQDFWNLSLFTSAPGALIPSLIYPDKPPLDEGVYFRSLLEGYHVVPPTAAVDLYRSSSPPETFGNGYAAFGAAGVIAFFVIKAALFVWGWKKAGRISAPFSVVFLVYFLYGFEISLFRIIQVVQVFVVCWVVAATLKLLTKRSGGMSATSIRGGGF